MPPWPFWIALGLFLAGVATSIAAAGLGNRLKRLEERQAEDRAAIEAAKKKMDESIDKINRSRSNTENKLQVWVGTIDVKMALIERELSGISHRSSTRPMQENKWKPRP